MPHEDPMQKFEEDVQAYLRLPQGEQKSKYGSLAKRYNSLTKMMNKSLHNEDLRFNADYGSLKRLHSQFSKSVEDYEKTSVQLGQSSSQGSSLPFLQKVSALQATPPIPLAPSPPLLVNVQNPPSVPLVAKQALTKQEKRGGVSPVKEEALVVPRPIPAFAKSMKNSTKSKSVEKEINAKINPVLPPLEVPLPPSKNQEKGGFLSWFSGLFVHKKNVPVSPQLAAELGITASIQAKTSVPTVRSDIPVSSPNLVSPKVLANTSDGKIPVAEARTPTVRLRPSEEATAFMPAYSNPEVSNAMPINMAGNSAINIPNLKLAKETPHEKIQPSRLQTQADPLQGTAFDQMYSLLQKNGEIKITTVAHTFNISDELAQQWATILESQDLAQIVYPPFGGPIVKLKK